MKRLIFCWALFLMANYIIAQNKIDKSTAKLTERQQTTTQRLKREPGNDDNDEPTLLGDAFRYTIGAVLRYGFIGDYEIEDHLYNDLTKYPFYDAEAGNFYNPKSDEGSIYEFRIDMADKFLISGNNLIGNHLEVKIRPLHAFYLKAQYYQLHEFQKAKGTNDALSLFYFNFAYDRIRFERFNLGWTLGASYIASGVNTAGFAFGLNADYFLRKRLSFSAGANWSFINSQPVHAYEAEIKIHRKNHFLSLGYERLKIADPVYNFMTLGGGIYF